MGYGDSGSVPRTFCLEKQNANVNVGILRLFLSKERVELSNKAKLEVLTQARHLWDTILVPMVQRCAANLK